MDGAPTPQTPYREGKPLAEIIPPDRRRLKAAALVVASMVTGISLWVLGGWVLEMRGRDEAAAPLDGRGTPGYVAGRLGPSMLHGPGGYFALPPARRSIVNVWLQGCADCMPAFEAFSRLESEGGFGLGAADVPIINVAYGEADQTWAQRYGVAKNLVFDPGGTSVVRPLGIGTFTTLVVEPNGTILHRDRPDRPGYAVRIRNAVLTGDPTTAPPWKQGDPMTTPPDPSSGGLLDAAAIQRVVAAHTREIKVACWDRAQADTPRAVSVRVTLTVAANGRVLSTSSSGDDVSVAKCVETKARTWVFPAAAAGGDATTLNIPFKFERQ